MLSLVHRPSRVEVEGVHKVLRGIERGTQKRFLHYYAPRTGKTLVQASLAYWLMRLSTLDLNGFDISGGKVATGKCLRLIGYRRSNSLLVGSESLARSFYI